MDIEKALENFNENIIKKLKEMAKNCNGKYKGEYNECLLSRTTVNSETVKYINNIIKVRSKILGCPFMEYDIPLYHNGLNYYANCKNETKQKQ